MPEFQEIQPYLETIFDALIAAIIVLSLWAAYSLKRSSNKYFEEKGKNLATKEDIGEITNTVKSIESELQYSLQGKLSWRKEKQDALVNYFTLYITWFTAISDTDCSLIDSQNFDKEIPKIKRELKEIRRQYDAARVRMEIFVDDYDFIKEALILRKETVFYEAHLQQYINHSRLIYQTIKHAYAAEENGETQRSIDSLLSQDEEAYNEYNDNLIADHDKIVELIQIHRRNISDYLKTHIES